MNREIKFRAWDKTENVMDYEMSYAGNISKNMNNAPGIGEGEDFSELMQYTGLKDNTKWAQLTDKEQEQWLQKGNTEEGWSGKEIYEGDIIIIEDEYTEPILDDGSGPIDEYNHLSAVVFKDACFGVDIKETADFFKKGFWSFNRIEYESGQTEFEVIGNIYEHPNLLKQTT